jgi:hypothetical protein
VVGAADGSIVTSAVDVAVVVSTQLFPLLELSSGAHFPEQHDAIHKHSTPLLKQPAAGTGAAVALQRLPVLDVALLLHSPLQQSACHRHSSSPCRHTGTSVEDVCSWPTAVVSWLSVVPSGLGVVLPGPS